MTLALGLPLVAFWLCLIGLALRRDGRARLRARTAEEWVLDLANLGVQGWLVPLGAAAVGPSLWGRWIAPGAWAIGPVGSFLIAFVAVDFLYYWNHRLLHAAWPLHRVHHTAPAMDVWVTSRNTLWSVAFLVYPWAGSLFLHALDAPEGYRLGAALTASLDLWRHSPLQQAMPGMITPRAHAWHHANQPHCNFGANFTWWDRAFGTWHDPGTWPTGLTSEPPLPLVRQLLWPFPRRA